jgi:hypothetical protein
MAIKHFLSLTFVLISILGYCQPVASHLLAPPAELSKGRAFRAIEEQSEVIFKGLQSYPHRVLKEFNEQGHIVSRIALNSAGGRESESHWEYFSGLKLLKKKHKFFANISGWTEDEVKVEWDVDRGLPLKVEITRNGKVMQWALSVIDTLGRIESLRVFGSTGAHTFTERFMYLESSNMVRVMVFKSNGVFTSNWTYPIDPTKEFSYDTVSRQFYPNGNVMIETLTDSNKGDQAYYYEYEYDSQGNWIEKRTYQANLGRNNTIRSKKLEHKLTRRIDYQ